MGQNNKKQRLNEHKRKVAAINREFHDNPSHDNSNYEEDSEVDEIIEKHDLN